MTDLRPPPRSGWRDPLVFGLVLSALLVAATLVMFSAFMFYDDEGYVLLSLKNFIEHGRLYRDVYTQYGPFPFVFHSALHALGLPITHTAGRFMTIAIWSGTAIACATLVGGVTRSLLARLFVLTAVFCYLWVMASEPTHPGGLIVLLTTLLGTRGYVLLQTGRTQRWALLAGATVGALLLTKINVGVFAAFSVGAWWLLHHQHAAVRRWAPALVAIAGIVLPFGLMRALLGTPWVQTYALLFAGAALTLAMTTGIAASPRTNGRTLSFGLLAAFGVALTVLGIAVARGTSLRDLLDGIAIAPLRQPTIFSLRYLWPPGIRAVALASLAACAGAAILRRRGLPWVDVVIATLRLAVALALVTNLLRYPQIGPDYLVLGCALPLLWIFVWPLAGEVAAVTSARAWLALLLLGQTLHAFPVAGSQIAWGTVLAIPLAALGAWDAATWLARHETIGRWLAPRGVALVTRLALVATTAWIGGQFVTVASRYSADGEYFALPGAGPIRLQEKPTALCRVMTLNAAAHADMLFSFPGMFSFNLWTGLPTPTLANVTHWFSLLDPERQQAIADALEAHPRACVIIDRRHVKFLTDHDLAPRGLLRDYIERAFEPAFVIDDFEFCVHRGRRIEPFLVAHQFTRAPAARASAAPESTLLTFKVLGPTDRPIARLELTAGTKSVVLDATNARLEVAPADARGQALTPPRPQAWPLAVAGPSIVFVYYDRERQPMNDANAAIVFRDAAGQETGLARLSP